MCLTSALLFSWEILICCPVITYIFGFLNSLLIWFNLHHSIVVDLDIWYYFLLPYWFNNRNSAFYPWKYYSLNGYICSQCYQIYILLLPGLRSNFDFYPGNLKGIAKAESYIDLCNIIYSKHQTVPHHEAYVDLNNWFFQLHAHIVCIYVVTSIET